MATPVKRCLTGKLVRDSAPGFVLGADHRDTLWLPEGEQVFSINHTVCTNGLGTVSHSYQLGWWEPSRKPRSRCQPTLPRGLSEGSSLRPAWKLFSAQRQSGKLIMLLGNVRMWGTTVHFVDVTTVIIKKKSYLLELYPKIFTDKMIQCLLFASKMGWGGSWWDRNSLLKLRDKVLGGSLNYPPYSVLVWNFPQYKVLGLFVCFSMKNQREMSKKRNEGEVEARERNRGPHHIWVVALSRQTQHCTQNIQQTRWWTLAPAQTGLTVTRKSGKP